MFSCTEHSALLQGHQIHPNLLHQLKKPDEAYLGATKAWALAAHAMAITADFILGRVGGVEKREEGWGMFSAGRTGENKVGRGWAMTTRTRHDEANLYIYRLRPSYSRRKLPTETIFKM